MKDWEYWQRQHLEEQTKSTLDWFKRIEKLTQSPIECIAMMHLIEFSDGYHPWELRVFIQHKIGDYTVDFLVYDYETETKIIVECDGHEFHEKTKKQAEHDKRRDRFLTKLGYIVLRYTGSQICEDPYEIVADVQQIISSALEKQSSSI